MKKIFDEMKSLIDDDTLYYFVLPISLALGIGGIYMAIMFYEFVLAG